LLLDVGEVDEVDEEEEVALEALLEVEVLPGIVAALT